MKQIIKILILCSVLNSCVSGSEQDGERSLPRLDSIVPSVLSQKKKPFQLAGDTIIVCDRVAVIIEPDSARIERSKMEVGEEVFYVGADDYLFYLNKSSEFLDSLKLTIIDVKEEKFLKFVLNDKSYHVIKPDTLPDLWNIYLFDPSRKAQKIDMTMIEDEYKNYFR